MHKRNVVVMLALLSVLALMPAVAQAGMSVAGTSTGIFQNPTGPGTMVVSGVDTNTFTWGSGSPGLPSSSLFTGLSFSTTTGAFFDVGTITYYNGTIVSGTGADGVDLSVTLTFTTPSGVTEAFVYTLGLINTLNTTDPVASADILQFPAGLPAQSFTVDNIEYTMAIEVGIVSGSGFSSQTTFSVLENGSATATLRGIVDERQILSGDPVPEPLTMTALFIGITGIAGYVRRRRTA